MSARARPAVFTGLALAVVVTLLGCTGDGDGATSTTRDTTTASTTSDGSTPGEAESETTGETTESTPAVPDDARLGDPPGPGCESVADTIGEITGLDLTDDRSSPCLLWPEDTTGETTIEVRWDEPDDGLSTLDENLLPEGFTRDEIADGVTALRVDDNGTLPGGICTVFASDSPFSVQITVLNNADVDDPAVVAIGDQCDMAWEIYRTLRAG